MKVRYSISEQWAKEDIHEIIDAIDFAIKYYDIQNDKATLTVKLVTGRGEKVEASANRTKNNRYQIRLSRESIEDRLDTVLSALFHEMTHVKQFIKDGFKMYSVSAEFQGEHYTLEDYWLSPWEMEARAMERALVQKYDEVR